MRDVFNKLGFVILELHPRVLQIANGDFAIICHLANQIYCSVLNLKEIHSSSSSEKVPVFIWKNDIRWSAIDDHFSYRHSLLCRGSDIQQTFVRKLAF